MFELDPSREHGIVQIGGTLYGELPARRKSLRVRSAIRSRSRGRSRIACAPPGRAPPSRLPALLRTLAPRGPAGPLARQAAAGLGFGLLDLVGGP